MGGVPAVHRRVRWHGGSSSCSSTPHKASLGNASGVRGQGVGGVIRWACSV